MQINIETQSQLVFQIKLFLNFFFVRGRLNMSMIAFPIFVGIISEAFSSKTIRKRIRESYLQGLNSVDKKNIKQNLKTRNKVS